MITIEVKEREVKDRKELKIFNSKQYVNKTFKIISTNYE